MVDGNTIVNLMKSTPTKPMMIQDEVFGDFILCCPCCHKPIYGTIGSVEPTECKYCGQRFLWEE